MHLELNSIRVLFLSYQSSHTRIFSTVINELQKNSNLIFKILESKNLINKKVSIRFSYRSELRSFERIIDEFKPDIFVVANDLGLSATFIRICRLRGIPSVAIQDGILTKRYSKGLSSMSVLESILSLAHYFDCE